MQQDCMPMTRLLLHVMITFKIDQNQGKQIFTNLYHWYIADKLSISNDKTNVVLILLKNKPVPRDFVRLQTQAMKIGRVQSVQYLGMLLDENLYWHEHVNQTCASLIKYSGIFDHIKNFVSVKIAKHLYFAFLHSRILYGVAINENCAKGTFYKLRVMQMNCRSYYQNKMGPHLQFYTIESRYYSLMICMLSKWYRF